MGRSSLYFEVSQHQSGQSVDDSATDIDTVAIVGDLKQLQAPILDNNFERSRASIHCVFDQFLQCMDWGDYDFASSNLIDNILVKSLCTPSASSLP